MKTVFDDIIDRNDTCSVKWDYNGERFGRKDILPMWVADMDFPSPPEVADAIVKRAAHGVFGYTGASEQLYGAITDWMKKRNNWAIEKTWTVHTPGVVTSIITAILTFTAPGDRILIQTPVYYPFFSSILDNDRQLVMNPLINNHGHYEIDFEDLEKKLKGGVKMFILCSPHNPVGRVWTAEELKRIAGLCIENGVLMVSDEIHSDLVYNEYKHVPIASLDVGILHNSITCISPTKTFNLAGLSQSTAIIPDAGLRRKFQKTLKMTGAGMLNIFGLEAAEAAYRYGEPWLEELMAYLSGNLDLLTGYFAEKIPTIKVARPEGTYLAWLDCKELSSKVGNLKKFFIWKAGVGLNEGEQFGEDGTGFHRINFACPRSVLLEGLQRIESAVKGLE